ncbi:MAG TPA: hypothetical protein ENJ55_04905, partial [Rhizobiales bacterium]|nr:hypothetical protein [Hyphomicrobiales bacterium]
MDNDTEHSIASLLARRNAALKGNSGDKSRARARSEVTHMIRRDYPAFEPIRDVLLKRHAANSHSGIFGEKETAIIEKLREHDLVSVNEGRHVASHAEAKRYLGGGWLEEMAWLA